MARATSFRLSSPAYALLIGGVATVLLAAPAPAQAPPSPVTPPASAIPAAAGTPAPTPPAILDVLISPDPLRAGRAGSVTIHTTPDVVEFHGHVMGRPFSIPKTGDGVFFFTGTVPWWAVFYHGAFRVTFIGSDDAGTQTERAGTVRI